MGISTSGFVLIEKKDVFAVLSTIEDTLIELVKKYSTGEFIFQDKTSKLPNIECRPVSRAFYIHFKVKDESRMLGVYLDCDCDYKEYGDSFEGAKII